MVSGGFNEEFKSAIPAARFWKAGVVDAHNLIPKIASDHISSVVLLQGDGGVGTIKQHNFTHAINGQNCLKHRVEMVDEANFIYKYCLVDAPGADKYEYVGTQVQFEAAGDGGCICKLSGEFKSIGDYIPSDEERKIAREGAVKTFKAVEAYLIANPHAYA